MINNDSMTLFDSYQSGQLCSVDNDSIVCYNLINGRFPDFHYEEGRSYYIYCYFGSINIKRANNNYRLTAGMYMVVSDEFKIDPFNLGNAMVVSYCHSEESNLKALFMVGGPLEEAGRQILDESSSRSILTMPMAGTEIIPTFVHYHLEPNVAKFKNQVENTDIIGIVANGSGQIITNAGSIPIHSGNIFLINKLSQYSLITSVENSLDVVFFMPQLNWLGS